MRVISADPANSTPGDSQSGSLPRATRPRLLTALPEVLRAVADFVERMGTLYGRDAP